jgi:hypothetical protein
MRLEAVEALAVVAAAQVRLAQTLVVELVATVEPVLNG